VPNIDYVEECSQQHLLNTVSTALHLTAAWHDKTAAHLPVTLAANPRTALPNSRVSALQRCSLNACH
jgi:hypothetical protein